MTIFSRKKLAPSTPFSDFIRKASSGEKKRVYAKVLEKATERQNALTRRVRESRDRDRIDIHDPDEVRNWTKSLGVSKEELERAIKAAGTQADKVREHLRGRK